MGREVRGAWWMEEGVEMGSGGDVTFERASCLTSFFGAIVVDSILNACTGSMYGYRRLRSPIQTWTSSDLVYSTVHRRNRGKRGNPDLETTTSSWVYLSTATALKEDYDSPLDGEY